MNELTAQELFDKVATHLLTQNKKAKSAAGHCVYRAPDGRKCAVGCLIPDEEYRPSIEGNGAGFLIRSGLVPSLEALLSHLGLVEQLQFVHDRSYVQDWRAELHGVARERHLSTSVLDEFGAP